VAPSWGITQAGYVAKPTTAILSDFESDELATMDPAIDLSPTGPLGQLNGIISNALSGLWQLVGVAFNANNRLATEGAGLDNIGDEVGIPRETSTYTQVACTLTFTSGTIGTTFPAGALVANVSGSPAFTFSNYVPLTVGSTAMNGVLFQAQTIGATTSVNPSTLKVITNPVSGWLSITNPYAQSQLGTNAELDAAYAARQEEELAIEGSCNPPATVAALLALAAAQMPPVTLTVTEIDNTTDASQSYGSLHVPPHSFALILYDSSGWEATPAGQAAIGQVIWNNKPVGIATVGSTTVTLTDPYLGTVTVYYSVPTAKPLYISTTVVIRNGFTFAAVVSNIQTALIEASTAPTPAGGTPPNGQLTPGTVVIGSQLEAVIMGVAGVSDVQVLTFDFHGTPTNTAPLAVTAVQVATLTVANAANIVVTQGTDP
jgi:uncharacterized phage protein gp47/JayE